MFLSKTFDIFIIKMIPVEVYWNHQNIKLKQLN